MRIIWWRKGKKILKPFDELTKEEIDNTRLAAKRLALHRAVDMGLFDDTLTDINSVVGDNR